MKVKYVLKSKKAFTLLESIIGLLCMSVIVLLLLSMVKLMEKNNLNNYYINNIATITSRMSDDFLISKEYFTSYNQLEIKTIDEQSIQYTCFDKKLVRSVNHMGTETLISNLESCSITNNNDNAIFNIKALGKEFKVYAGDHQI